MISIRTVLRSKYAVSMLILGVLTGVLALPEMALSFGNVTFGLGLLVAPIIFNLFFYGLCFAPIAFWGRGAWKITVAFVLAVAFVPGLFARVQQERIVGKIAAADVSADLEKAPKVLDLVGDLSRRLPSPRTNKTCGRVCQYSLQSGAVELVRMFDARELSSGKSGLAYRLDANGAIVFTEDTRPAELTLAINEFQKPSKIKEEYGFSDPLGIDFGLFKQLRATSGGYSERENAPILWQQTGYFAGRSGIPAVFIPNIAGLKNMRNPGGIKIFPKSITTIRNRPSVDNAGEVLKLYSHREASQRFRNSRRDPAEELAHAASLLRSVYELKAAVLPNSASIPAAKEWARQLERQASISFSEGDRAMVRNMHASGDKHLRGPIITAIIADDALLKEYLPEAFADLATKNFEATEFARELLLEIWRSDLSQEQLTPFAPEMRSLMEQQILRDADLYSFYLLRMATRFGIELRPYLEALSFKALENTHRNWTSHACKFPMRDLNVLNLVFQERLREDDRSATNQVKLPIFVDRHDYETRCRIYQ